MRKTDSMARDLKKYYKIVRCDGMSTGLYRDEFETEEEAEVYLADWIYGMPFVEFEIKPIYRIVWA